MEDEIQPTIVPAHAKEQEHNADESQRRGAALDMFVGNPQRVVEEFPDLIDDLTVFVGHSTNPYANNVNSTIASKGMDQKFEDWNEAKAWAVNYGQEKQ